MEKEFLPYELAIKLKEMGFDEECLASFIKLTNGDMYLLVGEINSRVIDELNNQFKTNKFEVLAPLWQQAFAFLLRNLKNRELIVALEFDGEVTLWEVITEDTYETYNKILASGNKESLEKLIELYSQLRKDIKN